MPALRPVPLGPVLLATAPLALAPAARAGGASLSRLDASFAIDTGGAAGLVTVNVTAVPEPVAAALLALGLATLGARRARTEAPR